MGKWVNLKYTFVPLKKTPVTHIKAKSIYEMYIFQMSKIQHKDT